MPKPIRSSTPTPEELEEKTRELEPLVHSPSLDKLLLKNARRSYADIAQITGIPVGEVAERLNTLLDSTNTRDDLQEEKLLLAEVGMLVDDIRTRMNRYDVEDEGWASMARVQLSALKALMEQVEKRRKAVNGELALVSKAQARLIGDAIKLAQERAIFNIVKQFPELDEEIIYAQFEEEFPKAIALLEKNAHE